jgi:hypothetical protein
MCIFICAYRVINLVTQTTNDVLSHVNIFNIKNIFNLQKIYPHHSFHMVLIYDKWKKIISTWHMKIMSIYV